MTNWFAIIYVVCFGVPALIRLIIMGVRKYRIKKGIIIVDKTPHVFKDCDCGSSVKTGVQYECPECGRVWVFKKSWIVSNEFDYIDRRIDEGYKTIV